MLQIPWWGLLLIAAVFALAGAAGALLVVVRRDRSTRRWYAERRTAYVDLLAIFERDTSLLRAAYDAGDKPGSPLDYVEVVAPALMQVRLLASGSVRSAALAVHMLLQKLHGEMNPAAVSGVQPQTHFRELLAQVPLVTQQLEAAIREELAIDPVAPALLTGRRRMLRRRPAREPVLEDREGLRHDRRGD